MKAWVIAKPSVGRYAPDVLRLEERASPAVGDGEVRVRPIYLSLDPSNLVWLKLLPGWMETVRVGDVMKGPAIGVVEESASPLLATGEIVSGVLFWQSTSVVAAEAMTRITPHPGLPLHAHLTLLSHVGRAAMIGMLDVAQARPDDEVLVSAAAGATGSLAAQIARAQGCRVVGIAGGPAKCAYLTEELCLAGAIDYKAEDLGAAIERHFPGGIDVYFDNVGGPTLDTALLHLKVGARIAICGAISQYGAAGPEDGYRYANLFQLLMKRARMEGFVAVTARGAEIDAQLLHLWAEGRLEVRAHVVRGLEQAADALTLLLAGENNGKLLVQVSEEPQVGLAREIGP